MSRKQTEGTVCHFQDVRRPVNLVDLVLLSWSVALREAEPSCELPYGGFMRQKAGVSARQQWHMPQSQHSGG